MSRCTQKLAGGGTMCANLVQHGNYVKPVPQNPYILTVHDGVSTGYQQGFSPKPVNWLYRFRHNLLPLGISHGHFIRNPGGKYTHYLEVTTMEKLLVRAKSQEGLPFTVACTLFVVCTIFHMARAMIWNPQYTFFNIVLWPNKAKVQQTRFSHKPNLFDKPFRYIERVPELYMEDPQRAVFQLGISANDPWLEWCKAHGRAADLTDGQWGKTMKVKQYIRPDMQPPKSGRLP